MTLAAIESTTATAVLTWAILLGVLLSLVLATICIFTIYRNPHFNELQKIGWLILALGLPIFGPVAWFSRAYWERKTRAHPDYVEGPDTSVEDFVEKLVPSHDPERTARVRPSTFAVRYASINGATAVSKIAVHNDATQKRSAGSKSVNVGTAGGKLTAQHRNVSFAPTSEISCAETSDSPENPHIVQGKEPGTRGLSF